MPKKDSVSSEAHEEQRNDDHHPVRMGISALRRDMAEKTRFPASPLAQAVRT